MERALDRLLVMADEQSVCIFLSLAAERMGFQVRLAATMEAFANLLSDFSPTAIVLDLNLPGTSGTEVLRDLADRSSPAQIFLTSYDGPEVLQTAKNLGVLHGLRMAGVFQKPLESDDIENAFGMAVGAQDDSAEAANNSETDVFQRFDRDEFEKTRKALADAEAAFTAALEVGRSMLAPEPAAILDSGRYRAHRTGS
ncbi:MAG: response regulator [Gammaproteobacteria bacterium]|nr:response regulator [Gammaproteobacteria bacterium]